jgi:hypothetical protein
MHGTADFHDRISDPRLPEAADVVDDAAALDAAVDMLNAHAPTSEAPIRRFLRLRERLSSWLPGWHEGLHLIERERQEAQLLEPPAPRRQGIRGGIRDAFIVDTARLGLTQKENREPSIDQQHVVDRVALFLAAITARVLSRILGALEAPFGPIVAERGEAGTAADAVDRATVGGDSSVGPTMAAALASAMSRRWAIAVNDRVGASPRVRSVARSTTKRT